MVDGPFAETKELIAGFWILQCRSKAEVIEWMRRCPNPYPSDGGYVEIRQVFEAEDFAPAAEFARSARRERTRRARRAIEAVWRLEAPRLIAGLMRLVRDVGAAEDLAHDALVAALEQWPSDGRAAQSRARG